MRWYASANSAEGPASSSVCEPARPPRVRRRADRAPSSTGSGRSRACAASIANPRSSRCFVASARSCSAGAGSPLSQRRRPIRKRAARGRGSRHAAGRSSRPAASWNAAARSASSAARTQAPTLPPSAPRRGDAARPPARCRLSPAERRPREWARSRFGNTTSSAIAPVSCVPPAVAVGGFGLLDEQLLRDGRLQRREHGGLVGLGDLDEQRVVERSAEDRRSPQDLDVLRVEPAQAEEHRLTHRLGTRAGSRRGAAAIEGFLSTSPRGRTGCLRAIVDERATSRSTSSVARIAAIISATCAGPIGSTATASASPLRRQT